MGNDKITVSLDEVNSTQVDTELHRQDVAERMAEHQEKIRVNFSGSQPINSQGGFFRQSMVYMAIFGIVFSIIAWFLGEQVIKVSYNHPWSVAANVISYIYKKYPNVTDYQIKEHFAEARKNIPEQQDNPFLLDSFLDKPEQERKAMINSAKTEIQILVALYYILAATIISIGLAIAEPCISKNGSLSLKNGFLGALLGALGGFIVSLFIDQLYGAMGGGRTDSMTLQQVLARGIAWGVLGLFIAIAPGIIMRSWKKFLLGIAGGLVGGLIGGLLFDPICVAFNSVAIARFVNIVGLGVGAAVATALLENIAKQGWLKVAAGLIAGKQFILYRNPTVIGSSPKCEIYLFKDPQIAAKHAAINNYNGEFFVSSIESAPVFVNNTVVQQRPLKNGDQLKIGNTTFVFEAKVLKKK